MLLESPLAYEEEILHCKVVDPSVIVHYNVVDPVESTHTPDSLH